MNTAERITFKNTRGKTIVGNLRSMNPHAIVLMAPGSCSDKSSQGRFDLYARGLHEIGLSTLAIDFSGCGESDDDFLTIEKEVDDLRSAIHFIHSKGYQKIGLFGNSLGGLISLMAYSPQIVTIAMTGGLTGPMKFDWDKLLSPEQKREREEKGHITVKDCHNMHRKQVLLDQIFFQEFERVNQEQLLKNVKCPVLMIHGDGDEEERSGHQLSQSGLLYLPKGSEIKVLPGADHGFWGHIDQVADLLQNWFGDHLSRKSDPSERSIDQSHH
ncbi:MAG: alpha/beta hydrolase [Proteobacteria bacterium]|nr:alpha/beta hydrolase [Pseudomonadota bacterium]